MSFMLSLIKRTGLVLLLSHAAGAWAQQPPVPSQLPLLVIGASYSEGKTPYNHDGVAPLGGVSVGFGDYLSLGQALTRAQGLPGFVINEAQAGATTFKRLFCAPGASICGPARWDSYKAQLVQALARVTVPEVFGGGLNARYVVITMPNDCLHSDAFGIPQAQTQPCTSTQMNEVVDRMIAVGRLALAKGVTPIYDVYPRYEKLDLPAFQAAFGLAWVIDGPSFNTLRTWSGMRIRAELPGAMVLDMWKEFTHGPDGLHPTREASEAAAKIVADALLANDP